jgi:hypothetical protein
MNIKTKKLLIYLLYIFFFVLFVYLFKIIFFGTSAVKTKPTDLIIETPFYTTSPDYVYNPYLYDSYEPWFVAPRYYDTQFIIYKQPVYTRSHGYHYPKRHNRHDRIRHYDGGRIGLRGGDKGGRGGRK